MIGIDKDTLQLIQATAQQAQASQQVRVIPDLPGEQRDKYLVVVGGEVTEHYPDPPPRRHTLGSVAEVSDFIKFTVEQCDGKPSIWYHTDQVTVVMDDTGVSRRLDYAVVEMHETPEFSWLEEAANRDLDQKQLIRVIRTSLWDALEEQAEPLLKLLRKMTFTTTDSGHGDLGPGRASYGKDLKGDVQSLAGDLATFEYLILHVRIYEDAALSARRTVRCLLQDDPLARTWTIVPLAGELRRAKDEEMAWLGERFAELGVPVFHGKP